MAQNRMTQQALLDHLDGADTDVLRPLEGSGAGDEGSPARVPLPQLGLLSAIASRRRPELANQSGTSQQRSLTVAGRGVRILSPQPSSAFFTVGKLERLLLALIYLGFV
jgi:hypothetical protein